VSVTEYATSDSVRTPTEARRAQRGYGFATPTRPLQVIYDGKRETLRPGVTRIRVEHELVRDRPEAFRPCDSTDHGTRDRLRSMQRRTTTRSTSRPTRSGTRKPLYGTGTVLPPRRQEQPWKLPPRT
jgi:hypothetical protein